MVVPGFQGFAFTVAVAGWRLPLEATLTAFVDKYGPQHHPDPTPDFLPAAPGHLPGRALYRGGPAPEHRCLPEPPGSDLARHPGAEPGPGAALRLPGPSPHWEQRFHLTPLLLTASASVRRASFSGPSVPSVLLVLDQPSLSQHLAPTMVLASHELGPELWGTSPGVSAVRICWLKSNAQQALRKEGSPSSHVLLRAASCESLAYSPSSMKNVPPPIKPSLELWTRLPSPLSFQNTFSYVTSLFPPSSHPRTNPIQLLLWQNLETGQGRICALDLHVVHFDPCIFRERIRIRAQLTCTSNCSSQRQVSWLECVSVESLPNSFLSQLSSTTHFLSLSPETSIKISMHAKSLQLCLTLWDPMKCSRPGSSVHGDSLSNNTREY